MNPVALPAAIALPAALLLLAGCAAPPAPAAAAPLPAGPGARLLLRGAVASEDRYAAVAYSDALACQGPRQLAAGLPQKAPEPAWLSAGTLATLDFVILRNDKPSCSVRWSFTPRAGRTYLLQGLALGSGCSARLVDASQPDRPQPVADAVLRSVPGQPCLPLAQARANAAASATIQGGQQDGEAVLNPRATTQGLEWLIRP
ncbi:MAG: hypothetical protein JNL87_18515 [Burkholderiaceae bacterium]|nr:hypothetical protein [Burkholderiaceae bacterium]